MAIWCQSIFFLYIIEIRQKKNVWLVAPTAGARLATYNLIL